MAICCRRKKFKVADATNEIKSIKKQKKNKFSKASFQGMNFSRKTSKTTKSVRFLDCTGYNVNHIPYCDGYAKKIPDHSICIEKSSVYFIYRMSSRAFLSEYDSSDNFQVEN